MQHYQSQSRLSLRKLFITPFWCWTFFLTCALVGNALSRDFTVATKRFTESYVLGDIVAQTLQNKTNLKVSTKQGMGSTGIVFNALLSGEVDVYPEYWGTLTQEILKSNEDITIDQVNALLLPKGLRAGVLLGFNNTYALAIRRELSESMQIRKISDLKHYPKLRLGLSQEFLARADGWPGLSKRYGLVDFRPTGLDHGLGYSSIAKSELDLIDAYSTDSRLTEGGLVLLEDDLHFFKSYQALLLMRNEAVPVGGEIDRALKSLEGVLSESRMQQLNARIELNHESVEAVAQSFLKELSNTDSSNTDSSSTDSKAKNLAKDLNSAVTEPNWQRDLRQFGLFFIGSDFLRLTTEQVALVFTSLFFAVLFGIPIGIFIYKRPVAGYPIRAVMGAIQTIPALALLSFLILIVHSIGFWPAFLALWLYALLPIIESTQSGLNLVDSSVKEASAALGTGFWRQLIKIELPLSSPVLFGGIQVAAVWTTGTATIAAFVGAGGYGERIAQGLSTNNTELMLEGAVPSAVFALVIQWLIGKIAGYFKVKE